MKIFNKNILVIALVVAFIFCLAGLSFMFVMPDLNLIKSNTVFAVSPVATPSLGTANTFGILANHFQHNIATTTITGTGDLGYTDQAGTGPLSIGGTTYVAPDVTYTAAGTAQGVALTNLNNQGPCTDISGPLEGVVINGGAPGTFPPGCYTSSGAMGITANGIVTLSGAGTYVFRPNGAITTGADSEVKVAGGASACDVFWAPTAATSLGANSTFIGTDIDAAGITIGNSVTWTGRALAYGGTVTADSDTITVPTCTDSGTIHIVKTVVNDNGGTLATTSFSFLVNDGVAQVFEADGQNDVSVVPGTYTITESAVTGYTTTYNNCSNLVISGGGSATCTITNNDTAPHLIVIKHVINNNSGVKVAGDFSTIITGVTTAVPTAVGAEAPGTDNILTSVGVYSVDESAGIGYYTKSLSSGCSGTIALGETKTCTITNDDFTPAVPPAGGSSYVAIIPPLIDVVKVPNPLALPTGPGSVVYTYTLSNIGNVAVTDITMVDNTCNPVFVSGDSDADAKLDLDEMWIYNCSTTLSTTHTNTVTTTGWANGLSAIDIANATVVVGAPIVPPLIHVTKVPSPLVLSAGGGMITYTNKVTNPGMVALSNIFLADDKCSPMKYISGDTNNDSKLSTTETWTYTCQTNLVKTTTNNVIASGEANGLTARDFAFATVVVAAPGIPVPVATVILPNTGFPPMEKNISRGIVLLAGILILISISLVAVLKKRTI